MAATSSFFCSWGYVILVSKFFVLFVDTGISKSFGVLIPTMIQRFGADYKTVGLICSLPVTLMYLCAPFSAIILKQFDNRFVAMAGGLLTGSCILSCAFIKNIAAAGGFLALSGIGLSMTYVPVVLAINDFFPENFVLMNTFTLYGLTAGSMLLPVVTESALQAYGYSGAFVILGGISMNLVVCGATVRQAPRNIHTGENHLEVSEEQPCLLGSDAEGRNTAGTSYQECLTESYDSHCDSQRGTVQDIPPSWTSTLLQTCRTSCGLLNEPLFIFSSLIPFLIHCTIYAWMLFLVPHAEQLGIRPSKAIFLSTVGGAGGVIGRTFFILLVHKGIKPFVVYIAIGTLCTASFLVDFTSSVYEGRMVMVFVQGFCFFIEDTIIGTLCKDAVFDATNFDMAIAICGFTGGAGTACGGAFAGYLFDATKSFTKVFTILGLIHAVTVGYIIVVVILLKRRQ